MTAVVGGDRSVLPPTTAGTDKDRDSDAPVNENNSTADPLTRRAETASSARTTSSSSSGRGCLAGWTLCPLCGDMSKKKYSLGRGIANHLNDVHTPWRPSKLAQKIHRRNYEAEERRKNRCRKRRRLEEGHAQKMGDIETNHDTEQNIPFQPLKVWEPSMEEQMAWKARIIQILTELEFIASVDSTKRQIILATSAYPATGFGDHNGNSESGGDKNGRPVASYRDSLPPFLQAAAQGDIHTLQDLIQQAMEEGIVDGIWTQSPISVKRVKELLDTKDRHNSTAEHWAAGGGHLKCLRYLYELRAEIVELTSRNYRVVDNGVKEDCDRKVEEKSSACTKKNNKIRSVRRRDGKTCLHYAARNGHVDCIRYLLTELDEHQRHSVDERSGEGATPLQLACYGGHPRAVKDLVMKYGADVHGTNDWGCSCSHWVAMTISTVDSDVREVCNYLRWQCGVSFVDRQKQGHSPLHKAALRKNRQVIQWLADPAKPVPDGSSSRMDGAGLTSVEKEHIGSPDEGGHRPSDIWINVGGDIGFANWMKETMKW